MESDTDKRVEDLEKANAGLLAAKTAETDRRQAMEVKMAEMSGKLDGLAKPSEPTVTEYSPAQLRGEVDSGKLTQSQADSISDRQTAVRQEQLAINAAQTVDNARTLDGRIGQYIEKIPSLGDTPANVGSPERARVKKEYDELVQTGSPANQATEYAALKAAFGPVDFLKEGKLVRETHQETGSDGGTSEGGDTGGKPKDMPDKNWAFAQEQDMKGIRTLTDSIESWNNYKKKVA